MLRKTLVMKTRGAVQALPLGRIIFLEKRSKRIRVHADGKDYYFYASFAEAQQDLDPRFYRFHRSFIVNMDRIRCLCGNRLVLDDDTVLRFSERPLLRLKWQYDEFVAWKRQMLRQGERERGPVGSGKG